MTRWYHLLVCFFLLGWGATVAAESLPLFQDPYALFEAHYQATGGLERWRALHSSYQEGTVREDGLNGTFRQWWCEPLQTRLEADFGIIRQSEGDNGRVAWYLDTNGQRDFQRDVQTLQRRELARRLAQFEHLSRNSVIFSLSMEAPATLEDHRCQVVRLENRLNSDVSWYYFDGRTLNLLAARTRLPDLTLVSRYDDFRTVDGLVVAFHQRDEMSPRNKVREVWLKRLDLNPTIASQRFVPPSPRPTPVYFAGGQSEVTLPFRLVDGAIYLPVTLNNDTRWWLLDSGASGTVIDADYARSCGLEVKGEISGFGYGDPFAVHFTTLPTVRVGKAPNTVTLAPHTVMACSGLVQGTYEPTCHGILGYDFLSRVVVRIDYAHRQLTLFPLNTPPALPWRDAPLKYRMLTLPVLVDGCLSGSWCVDTGAEYSAFFAPSAQRYRLRERKGVEQLSLGIGGWRIDRLVRFDGLQLAGMHIERPVLSVPSAGDGGMRSVGELDGTLGASTLRHFVLWLDCSRQKLALMPGDDFNAPQALDKSGLLVGLSHDGVPMVSFVASGTPAQRAGFVAGDLIEAIDGRPVDQFDGARAIRALLRKEVGRCYRFQLRRDGEVRELQLCLEELL
ncbi:MAG: aspartyl protease family protein [Desulfuromonadaceae bacterium]|nr:aspartyl protease family protein [Desulfuromonadaceae bacterium]